MNSINLVIVFWIIVDSCCPLHWSRMNLQPCYMKSAIICHVFFFVWFLRFVLGFLFIFFFFWKTIMAPRHWPARCLPTHCHPIHHHETLHQAGTCLQLWLMSNLPSSSTELERSMALLWEPSECTWVTLTSTLYITWSGWVSHQI